MKKILLFVFAILLITNSVYPQISGVKTIPSTNYPTIKTVVDSLNTFGVGTGGVVFEVSAVGGTGYYISLEHRNSIQTWTADGTNIFSLITGTKNYDFTNAQTQAYGSNLIQVGTKWCIINGDLSRDDYIDGSDYLDIINNYDVSGEYMNADANGDDYIDGSDYLPIINNYDVGAVTPTAPFRNMKQKVIKPLNESLKQLKREIKNKK